MKNQDIRNLISKNNLKYWQVANKYGLSDGNFSRLLRYTLSDDVKAKLIEIINELKEMKEIDK